MIHDLTFGFLDLAAVALRQIRPIRPLESTTLVGLGIAPGRLFGGHPVELGDEFFRIRVYAPLPNAPALALALCAVRDFGLVAADVEHARVWPAAEIETALRATSPVGRFDIRDGESARVRRCIQCRRTE